MPLQMYVGSAESDTAHEAFGPPVRVREELFHDRLLHESIAGLIGRGSFVDMEELQRGSSVIATFLGDDREPDASCSAPKTGAFPLSTGPVTPASRSPFSISSISPWTMPQFLSNILTATVHCGPTPRTRAFFALSVTLIFGSRCQLFSTRLYCS